MRPQRTNISPHSHRHPPSSLHLCVRQMLADPEYMRAAKKKMEQLKGKARLQGLSDDAAGMMQAMMGRAI